MTSSTIASIDTASEIWWKPRSRMTSSTLRPSTTCASKTSLAFAFVIRPSTTRRMSAGTSPGAEKLGLALDLEADRPLHAPKRVHVLDLDPDAEPLLAAWSDRDVRFDPHLAPLHVRVGHPNRAHQELQLLRVAPRRLRGPQVS